MCELATIVLGFRNMRKSCPSLTYAAQPALLFELLLPGLSSSLARSSQSGGKKRCGVSLCRKDVIVSVYVCVLRSVVLLCDHSQFGRNVYQWDLASTCSASTP
jgi:hypothetical protein